MTSPFIAALLSDALDQEASDIHLSTGSVPLLRILGDLVPLPGASRLEQSKVEHSRDALSPSGKFSSAQPDFSYHDAETGRRLRINAYTTVRGPALAIRLIPSKTLSLEEIAAPPLLKTLALLPRGLVLVTGPTGSGKSATLAAMVDYINRQRRSHILSLEDPIEYLHDNINCLVSQREIHTHARGYAAALKDAVREDPNVIMVGEMRDPDTIRLCLTAAETGHLVLSTLHTRSAPQAIDRIIDVFPAGEKEMVRTMLAESLQGIVAQTLVRHRDGKRRIAVFETLACTPAVRNCIRDSQVAQIRGTMSTSRAHGMGTLDQALTSKVAAREITQDEARRVAQDQSQF